MPYGRPIIRSLSQNYHEAEVKYFFSPIFTSDKEIAKIIDKGRHKKKSIFLGKSPKLWVGGGKCPKLVKIRAF